MNHKSINANVYMNSIDEFIQRSAHYLNFVFAPDRISGLIDSFSTAIMLELPRHFLRWENTCTEDIFFCSVIASIGQWENNILSLKEFASERPSILRNNIIDYFSLTGLAELIIDISDNNGGIYHHMEFSYIYNVNDIS